MEGFSIWEGELSQAYIKFGRMTSGLDWDKVNFS